MKRVLKWVGIFFGVFVLVIIAAILILPRVVDVQKYKPWLESKVSEATGRPMSVAGDVKLSVFPWLGVSFSDLTLGNTKGFEEKEFVSISAFDARVKLIPLLSRKIQLKRFVIHEPKITMIKNKDGRVNWVQPKSAETEKKDKKGPAGDLALPIKALYVGEFAIDNGSLVMIDHASGARHEVTDINAALTDVSLENPIKLALSALYDNKSLKVTGTAGPVGKVIGQQPIALDLTIDALKELKMTLKGVLENPLANPTVKLAVVMNEFSPRRLMEALGMALPVQTADSNALNRVALTADVNASAKAAAISNANLDLDDSKLAFSLKASDFSRPNLTFDMNLDQIDLDRYLPPKSEKAAAEKGGAAAKPASKPNFKPLRKMIVDGTVKIGKLTVSKAKLNSVLLKVKAKDGIINLDPIKMALYDGNFAGKTVVDVRTDTPATNVSATVNGVQVNPLMQDVMAKDILEGTTTAQIDLSMAGADAAAIKRTLTGKGQLTFNDGAIKGFDLAAMARNTKAAFGLEQKPAQRPKTDFAELSMPFTLENGLFNTPMTALKSPLIRLEAKGDAHLVQESLDFRVDPKVVASLKGQGDEQQRTGLLVPVIITGTFSAPKFRPDLEALAKANLNIDKKELEAKARETLDKKADDVLGDKAEAVKGLLGQGKKTDQKSAEETKTEGGEKAKSESSEDKAKGLVKGLFKSD